MGVPVPWYGLSTSTFPPCICFLEQKGTLCVGRLTAARLLNVLSCMWSEHQSILVVTVNINLPAFQRQAWRTNDVGKGLCGDKNVMCCCCQFNIIKLVVSSKISCFDISFLVACSFCWNRLWWFYDSCQKLEHTAHSLHFSVFYAKAVGEN